jgi:hypothetical protein
MDDGVHLIGVSRFRQAAAVGGIFVMDRIFVDGMSQDGGGVEKTGDGRRFGAFD